MLNYLREKFLLRKLNEEETEIKGIIIVFGILIVGLFAGMFYLLTTIGSQNKTYTLNQNKSPTPSTPSPTPCSDCITPTLKEETKKKSSSEVIQEPSVKEYFISFGSSSGQSENWSDVAGLAASVDLGNYQNIKEIRFETSINVPTANESVSVRLFNKTDQHAVWNSEITMSGGPSSYLVSSPIVYDKGSKLYQVQIKTQLNYPANIVQSRLHIILK